jgi:hypothetical protein
MRHACDPTAGQDGLGDTLTYVLRSPLFEYERVRGQRPRRSASARRAKYPDRSNFGVLQFSSYAVHRLIGWDQRIRGTEKSSNKASVHWTLVRKDGPMPGLT